MLNFVHVHPHPFATRAARPWPVSRSFCDGFYPVLNLSISRSTLNYMGGFFNILFVDVTGIAGSIDHSWLPACSFPEATDFHS